MVRIVAGDEIEIRLLEEHHAEEMFAVIDRNRAHIRRWLPWPDYTQSPDDSREFIRKCVFEYAHQQTMACGIWYGSRFAGGIGAHLDCANRTASVGYWIDRDLVGKGIVIRATEALVRYLFAHWACNRIEIRCATENTRSRAIPERLGFRNEGTLRSAFVLGDRVLDIVVYSMLRAEWDAATARGPE